MYHIPLGVFPSVLKKPTSLSCVCLSPQIIVPPLPQQEPNMWNLFGKEHSSAMFEYSIPSFFHKVIKSIQHFRFVFIKFTWMYISYIHIILLSTQWFHAFVVFRFKFLTIYFNYHRITSLLLWHILCMLLIFLYYQHLE